MVGKIVIALIIAVVTYVVLLIVVAILNTLIPEAHTVTDVIARFGWILALGAGAYYYFTNRRAV